MFQDDSCKEPLGMQDNSIPDSDITASSSLGPSAYAPKNARLHYTGGPGRLGGWIPRANDHDNYRPYLQISFGRDTLVTGIATQGFHNANYYVTRYKLEYIDPRGYTIHYYTKWHTWVNILANDF